MLRTCLAVFFVACSVFPNAVRGADGRVGEQEKYALLVGCTRYSDPAIESLIAPANEVKRWAEILTDPAGFSFPLVNVEQLVGWPDQLDKRPTHDNIAKAFEKLISKAGPSTQIVILLSGHGTQSPISETQDPLDPKNPELDGLDEIFLPADAMLAHGLIKGIKDDEIGAWLVQMRELGASVWIIFDCCHAGMMARGGPGGAHNPFQTPRFVDPTNFGIRKEEIDRAVSRAREAVQCAEKRGETPRDDLKAEIRVKENSPGKLVAFYAAQPSETSPELYRPDGADHRPENCYGLFSYSILQELKTRRGPLSYRHLIHRVITQYRSSGRMDWPTPFAEGDLEQGVLGLTVWPSQCLGVLERIGNEMILDAGELAGLTPGSILSVHPPEGLGRDEKETLGFIRVERVSATSAVVRPCAYKGSPRVDPDSLPELARCELVSRDFGDRTVRLFLDGPESLHDAFSKVREDVKAMAKVCSREDEAHLVFRAVSSKQAEEHYALRIVEDNCLLLLPSGFNRNEPKRRASGKPLAHRIYGVYPFQRGEEITRAIEQDLPKIFRWQNMWRIANGVNALEGGETHGLVLDVLELKSKNDRKGEHLSDMVVDSGQTLEVRLSNKGPEDLWVVLLFLDANLGIEVKFSGSLGHRQTLKPSNFLELNGEDGRSGVEGVVVLGIPIHTSLGDPDFSFLAQARLHVVEPPKKSLPGPDARAGQLVQGGVLDEKVRSAERKNPATPVILAKSWLLIPKTP